MAINPVSLAGLGQSVFEPASTGSAPAAQGGFARLMNQMLDQAASQHGQATQAVNDLALGKTDDVHGVTLAVAKADIAFRLVLEIRNRLSDAFQEIMRMQV